MTFLGCTLWTDFELFGNARVAGYEAQQQMTDYRKIRVSPTYRKLRSLDTSIEHWNSVQWLKRELRNKADEKVVVVTHHSPTVLSIPEPLRKDLLSAAYASHLDDVVASNTVALWVHGHVHSPSDFVIGATRIVCNPRGYPDEPVLGFKRDLVVEV